VQVSSLCSSRTSTTQQPGTSASSPQPQWVTYGDVQITTEGARCFTCIYITVSVSWLAAVVSLIGRLLEQRSADEKLYTLVTVSPTEAQVTLNLAGLVPGE
jgi:hypothetical protein